MTFSYFLQLYISFEFHFNTFEYSLIDLSEH